MREIKVSELKPGIRFTQPVYLDEKNLFLPKDIPLKKKDIEKLIKWGISEVFSDGEILDPENASDILLMISSFQTDFQKEIYELLKSNIAKTAKIFDKIAKIERVEREEIDTVVDSLVKVIDVYKRDVIHFVLYSGIQSYDLPANAVSIALISLLLADTMDYPRHKKIALATGALLHDVGMYRVPGTILSKDSSLSDVEYKQMKAHTVYSYRIIRNELSYSEDVALVALQHHERWDGNGYPRNLESASISEYARIVSIADAFQAMISERPYRSPLTGYSAMRTILGDNGRRFDPDIVKEFIKTMGIYPLGSIVLLNNGAVGVVVDTSTESPLRPELRILIDENGKDFLSNNGPVLNLQKSKSVFIVKVVEPSEIRSKLPA
ncbi:HD-GYP domain-containing protein [Spirochaetia bacterium 38H-sp]|uniref:HD-GYP domain-containing protein n=1 Tax=Rarispira pelagica TaxID=3141764 RepID=A0ABU9UB17_9SPIR